MSTTTDRGATPGGAAPAADLTRLAARDRRVARTLAAAERERLVLAQQTAAQDAAAERTLRTAEGRLRLAKQREQITAARAERRRQARAAARKARRDRRRARRAEAAAWWARRVDYARTNAAAVYSAVIYSMAVAGAVYGQIDAARAHGQPTLAGVVAAVAIEGTGLAMALTAQQQRLKHHERALAARVLTWIATAAAVAINYVGHHDDPAKAVGLSVLSALGIVVWEVRSGAKHRPALRKVGMLPDPPERFGWRRWGAYPRSTWAAWRLDVRDRLSPGAAALLTRAEVAAAARVTAKAQARVDADRQRVRRQVSRLAGEAARRATKRGESGPVLVALLNLARTGEPPAGQPALPAAPAPVDPQIRELCDLVRRQSAEARGRLFGTTPPPSAARAAAGGLRKPPTQPPGSGPAEPAGPATGEPARRRGEPGNPTQPGPDEPTREPAHRRGSEPGSTHRRRAAGPTRGPGRRLTLAGDGDSADSDAALAAAYTGLRASLAREPSGAELAARTGVSKATANRWKACRAGGP